MGIFSFLSGDDRNREPDGRRQDDATSESAPDRSGETRVPPTPEPGNGIADVEPVARGPEAAAARPAAEPPDWWRSAPGAPAPSPPPAYAGGAPWDMGAFLEPGPATTGPGLEVGPADPKNTLELKPKIVDALGTVFDPEIPVNIYELGLIYEVVIDASARVLIRMTLTSPACPSAQQLPSEVQYKVKAVPGVADAAVEVVWDPPWSKDMMSDAARLSLGIW